MVAGELVAVERDRVGVLARLVEAAVLELGVGEEGFVGELVTLVGDDFVGEEDGVPGSGNSLG